MYWNSSRLNWTDEVFWCFASQSDTPCIPGSSDLVCTMGAEIHPKSLPILAEFLHIYLVKLQQPHTGSSPQMVVQEGKSPQIPLIHLPSYNGTSMCATPRIVLVLILGFEFSTTSGQGQVVARNSRGKMAGFRTNPSKRQECLGLGRRDISSDQIDEGRGEK